MKRKAVVIISILVVIIGIGLYSYASDREIKSYIAKDMKVDFPDKFVTYDILRCNFGINDIEYGFVGEYVNRIDNLKIFFYNMKRDSIFSINDWNDEYIGGTTIKNTTFPELVSMVKEDCSQFQEGHGDYYGEDLAWSYSPYEPEPEKSDAVKAFEKRQREKAFDEAVEEGRIIGVDNFEDAKAELIRQGLSPEAAEEIARERYPE